MITSARLLFLFSVLWFSVPVLALSLIGAPSDAASEITGRNVGVVRFASGSFEKEGDVWLEKRADGTPAFSFTETGRDEGSVYLVDRSRNVQIQLDLARGQIFYADANNPLRPLYDMTGAGLLGPSNGYDRVPAAPAAKEPAKLLGPLSVKNQESGLLLATSNGQLTAASGGGQGSGWFIEPVGERRPPEFVRLKSQATGNYLHVQYDSPMVGQIEPGWYSAMWVMQKDGGDYAFRNRWKESEYLYMSPTGSPSSGPISVRSSAAWWSLAAASTGPSAPSPGGDRMGGDGQVSLVIQNFSRSPLDIFLEVAGELNYVETLAANQQISLPSKAGMRWQLAQGERWVGRYTATAQPEQVVPYEP